MDAHDAPGHDDHGGWTRERLAAIVDAETNDSYAVVAQRKQLRG